MRMRLPQGRVEDVGALGPMLTCRHRYRNRGPGCAREFEYIHTIRQFWTTWTLRFLEVGHLYLGFLGEVHST